MKNLIVYLSSLENGDNIIDYSVHVAQYLDLNIHYVYNVDSKYVESFKTEENISKDELEKRIVEEKKWEIEKLVQKQNWVEKNITAVYSIYAGAFNEMFETLALKNHSELILFPVEEDGKISDEKLIYQALDIMNLPVWCFSAKKEFRQVKTIVYGSNYQKEDIDVLKSLSQMGKKFGAKIDVLHIYKNEKYRQQLINSGFKDIIDKKVDYKEIEIYSKKKSSTVNGIVDFCKSSFADLVVLLKKDKYFFQELFRKSKTEKILKKTDLPVLIFKK